MIMRMIFNFNFLNFTIFLKLKVTKGEKLKKSFVKRETYQASKHEGQKILQELVVMKQFEVSTNVNSFSLI
jgi:hypothetical protein